MAWIIDTTKSALNPPLKEVRDSTLSDGEYSPPGNKKYTPRKGGRWCYVHWGMTPEEAVASHNLSFNKQLAELKAEYEAEVLNITQRMARR